MKTRWRALLIIGVVVGAMVLAGCSGDGDLTVDGSGVTVTTGGGSGGGDTGGGDSGGDDSGGEAPATTAAPSNSGGDSGSTSSGSTSEESSNSNTWIIVLLGVLGIGLVVWLASRSGAQRGAQQQAEAQAEAQQQYQQESGEIPPPPPGEVPPQ